jgi:hypothetical protein
MIKKSTHLFYKQIFGVQIFNLWHNMCQSLENSIQTIMNF